MEMLSVSSRARTVTQVVHMSRHGDFMKPEEKQNIIEILLSF